MVSLEIKFSPDVPSTRININRDEMSESTSDTRYREIREDK